MLKDSDTERRTDSYSRSVFLHWSASGYDAFIIGILFLTVEQLLIVAAPPQAILVKIMFDQRFKGVKITDARVRLITEVSFFFPQSYPIHTSPGSSRNPISQVLWLGGLLRREDSRDADERGQNYSQVCVSSISAEISTHLVTAEQLGNVDTSRHVHSNANPRNDLVIGTF